MKRMFYDKISLMPKVFSSERQKIGEKGEEMACMFLVKQGFRVLERNYTRKCGEIDIVAKKDSHLYFIEVKSVSCEIFPGNGSRETKENRLRPEENMNYMKLKKFQKTVMVYLSERHVSHETDWSIDLLCVYLNTRERKARVIPYWNVI